MTISAFVITYNRPEILPACLKRVRWVDELILVDKHPEGKNRRFANEFGAHYAQAEWTPVVEDTRAYAQSLCHGDWVICLDDDEILSRECAEIYPSLIKDHQAADVFSVPIRHWVLGRVSDIEYRPNLYRMGSITYEGKVHKGTHVMGLVKKLDKDSAAHIMHLSCPGVAAWVEKTNRYTSSSNRGKVKWPIDELKYESVIKTLYDMYMVIDVLKQWEETQPNGHDVFALLVSNIMEE